MPGAGAMAENEIIGPVEKFKQPVHVETADQQKARTDDPSN